MLPIKRNASETHVFFYQKILFSFFCLSFFKFPHHERQRDQLQKISASRRIWSSRKSEKVASFTSPSPMTINKTAAFFLTVSTVEFEGSSLIGTTINSVSLAFLCVTHRMALKEDTRAHVKLKQRSCPLLITSVGVIDFVTSFVNH